jgi:ankyrin repeat protein
VVLLVKAGADITIKYEGKAAVHYAEGPKAFELVAAIAEHAQDDGSDECQFGSALLTALHNSQFDLAKKILTKRSVLNQKNLLHAACGQNTPLELVEKLIELKVAFNEQDASGKTPLQIAIENDNADIVATLIKAGGTVAIKDEKIKAQLYSRALLDALLCQQFYSARKILKMSIELTLNEFTAPENSMSLLHVAVCQNAPLDVFNRLLIKGADRNKVDSKGHKPLDLAISMGLSPIIQVLQKPKLFKVNVVALQEFMLLHRLGHWHIAKLPTEILVNIAVQLGYDEYYANSIYKVAGKALQASKALFDLPFYELLDQYGCVPKALEVALNQLDAMEELEERSFASLFSTKNERKRLRIDYILKLSEALIARNFGSALAFYMRGLYGHQGQKFLAIALKRSADNSLNTSQHKHLQSMMNSL